MFYALLDSFLPIVKIVNDNDSYQNNIGLKQVEESLFMAWKKNSNLRFFWIDCGTEKIFESL